MTDYYDTCYACNGHVFKPKRMTKRDLYSREFCVCMCHWGDRNSLGITYEEAVLINQRSKKSK